LFAGEVFGLPFSGDLFEYAFMLVVYQAGRVNIERQQFADSRILGYGALPTKIIQQNIAKKAEQYLNQVDQSFAFPPLGSSFTPITSRNSFICF
jgi:hypothetical protein